MSDIRYYFDESVELVASIRLAAYGYDVVSAHSLLQLGDTDQNHLHRATKLGRTICTYDADFLALAASGVEHAGIIYARQQKASIGGWIREIRLLHAQYSAEEIQNRVIFLSMR